MIVDVGTKQASWISDLSSKRSWRLLPTSTGLVAPGRQESSADAAAIVYTMAGSLIEVPTSLTGGIRSRCACKRVQGRQAGSAWAIQADTDMRHAQSGIVQEYKVGSTSASSYRVRKCFTQVGPVLSLFRILFLSRLAFRAMTMSVKSMDPHFKSLVKLEQPGHCLKMLSVVQPDEWVD